MAKKKQSNDPGLGQKYSKRTPQKIINDDGTFNVRRIGNNSFLNDAYHYLLHLSWFKFTVLVFIFYFIANLIFALLYYLIGVENLNGANMETEIDQFFSAFFFSVQTFTTVGYGGISPTGGAANAVASVEALIGLIGFAFITGMMYGRFSNPTAKILFSENALISPYKKDSRGLMLRVANRRRNELIETSATLLMMTVEKRGEEFSRNYSRLDLELDSINFFPLNWTIVHPIDENSPLYQKDKKYFEDHDVEFLVLIKSFDDTFSQTVYARYSYKWDQVIWGAKYKRPFKIDDDGQVVMNLKDLNNYDEATLPGQ